MTETSTRHVPRSIALGVVTGFLIGCDSARAPSGIPSLPNVTASKTSGVTVTAANPSFGRQGQVSEAVTITGTGFAPGEQVAWVRNGVVDTTIMVTSTQYVSSTTLIATINISPKSPVDFRDVQVMNSGRTQGIGSLLFEVTQAIPISGTSYATLQGRRVGNDAYGARVRLGADGSIQVHATRELAGTTTALSGGVVAGLTFAPNDQLLVRTQVVGASPTTIRVKVWKVGTTEPADWRATTTDASAALQVGGGVGVTVYHGGTTGNPATVFAWDDLVARPVV